MKFCTYCGKQLTEEALFCPNCGHKAAHGDLPRSDDHAFTAQSDPSPASQTPSYPESPVRQTAAPSGKNKFGTAGCILALLALIPCIAMLVSGSSIASSRDLEGVLNSVTAVIVWSAIAGILCTPALPLSIVGVIMGKRKNLPTGGAIAGIVFFAIDFILLIIAIVVMDTAALGQTYSTLGLFL